MFKSDRILTLDIGASKLVLAEFKAARSGAPQLMRYGIGTLDVSGDWDADPSAFIVAALRDVMRTHRIRPAPLLMSVSGQAVFPRYVKLPPVGRDKIAAMVHYEAEQNVPFPIDEVIWDYQLIGDAQDELNVMLVAAKIESIKRLTDCVEAAGLEPSVVDVAPMALYNAVRYNYPDAEGCTMVLDIGARSSNLIFVEQNRIFSRSIPVAGNAVTQELMKEFDIPHDEARDLKHTQGFVALGGNYAGPDDRTADRVSRLVRGVVTRLHAEVSRSINFYRSQQGGSFPTRILLAGGSAVMPHMDTFFREKLKAPVDVLNPFVAIPVSPAIEPDRIMGDIHVLGEVTGLALRRGLTCPAEINLLPPDLVARRTLRRRQPFFALGALGLVLIMLCWWAYFLRMREMLDERMALVNERIGGLSAQSDELKAVRTETERVEGQVRELTAVAGRRTVWLEVLAGLEASLIRGMWLTGIQPVVSGDRITHLTVSGRGFVDRLRDTPEATATEQWIARLQAMDVFGDGTRPVREPVVGSDAFDREFTVRVELTRPIELLPTRLDAGLSGEEP